jgi:hypothetical protein
MLRITTYRQILSSRSTHAMSQTATSCLPTNAAQRLSQTLAVLGSTPFAASPFHNDIVDNNPKAVPAPACKSNEGPRCRHSRMPSLPSDVSHRQGNRQASTKPYAPRASETKRFCATNQTARTRHGSRSCMVMSHFHPVADIGHILRHQHHE